MAGMTKAVDAACIKEAIVSGAGADTNIAVTGIATEDQLIAVWEKDGSTHALTSRTSTTSITSAGNIQCTVATTGDTLMVLWLDRSA